MHLAFEISHLQPESTYATVGKQITPAPTPIPQRQYAILCYILIYHAHILVIQIPYQPFHMGAAHKTRHPCVVPAIAIGSYYIGEVHTDMTELPG